MSQKPVLILFAHPALEKSRVNRILGDEVRNLPGITFHDLYETYPEFLIDVEREQELLVAHDRIVLQHPFLWYSVPALLKEWFDLVLEHGWAYGTGGTRLRGKRMLSAITTGGGIAAYAGGGFNRYTMRQFLSPVEQTMRLCGLEYPPPFIIHGTHRLEENGIADHAREYRTLIEAFRDGLIDWDKTENLLRINDALSSVIRTPEAAQ